MSDTKLGVTFTANTDPAQQAVAALTHAIRKNVDETDNAGKATKQHSKELSATRAKQLELLEAVRRAKDAQTEANLVTKAYGERSQEAARATAKLIQAQAEVRRATAAVNEQLEKSAKAINAVAIAEDGATSATKRAGAQLVRMASDVERTTLEFRKMELQAKASSQTTNKMTAGMSALSVAGGSLLASGAARAVTGVGDALSFTFRSAIEMESGMADVAKVVDGLKTPAGEATAEYHAMEEALFGLSEQIAIAPEGFAALAAAAGSAGIAGKELVGFAEDAAKVAVAFDVTADEAGTGLVKLRTGLSLSQPQVMELAGSINVLSNAMAATAPQIMDAVQRVGSIGKATNVSGQEIAALSTAMISAGASAEQAGTGTKNFLLALSIGSAATKHQVEAFEALGLSAQKVAENVTSRDAITRAEQMRQVVERIGELGDADRVSVMSKLFGKETLGTIGPLATNLELLTESLELAGDRTKALGSVQAEFQSRSATTANTLQLLKNNISVTAIAIGSDLLPELATMAQDMSAWVKQNRELIKDNVVGFVHGLRDAVVGIAPYVIGLAKAGMAVIEMLGGVERSIGPVTAGLGALRIASTLALGPWGVLAAGIIAGAVAISAEMADAERRTMSLIQAAGRLKDVRLTGFGLESKSAQELLQMQQDLNAEREKAQTISGTSRSGRFLSPEELKQAERERQADVAAIDARGKLISDALATKTKELETSINIRKENERTAAAEATRADKLKLELEYLNGLDKLSAAQARRKKALEKVGVEADEDSGSKKKGRGGKKTTAEMMDPGSVAQARIFNGVEQTELVARAAPEAAAAGRAEAEQALFERRQLLAERELELLDAQAKGEAQRIDGIFFSIEVENEAETRRAELQDQKLKRELEYAQWQVTNARTEVQREQALTKLEEVEHRKRVAAAQREAAEEHKIAEQRRATFERIAGGVRDLSGSMVEAVWEQAQGQKGAIAMMLGDRLKGISIDATVTAAWETAQGVAALAGVYTAGLAPGHFLAAAEAAGVAALAGAAGVGFSAAGKAASGGGGGGSSRPAAANDAGGGVPGSSRGGNAAPGGDRERLERQEVPVSYADSAAPASGPQVIINIQHYVGGKDSEKALADTVAKSLVKYKAQGARP